MVINMTNRFSHKLNKGKNEMHTFRASLLSAVTDSIRRVMYIDVESELDQVEFEWFRVKSIAKEYEGIDRMCRMPPFFNNTHVNTIFKCDDSILDQEGSGMLSGMYYLRWNTKIWTPNGLELKSGSTNMMCADLFLENWMVKNIAYHSVGHEVDFDKAIKTLLIPSNELQRSYEVLEAMGPRYFHQHSTS